MNELTLARRRVSCLRNRSLSRSPCSRHWAMCSHPPRLPKSPRRRTASGTAMCDLLRSPQTAVHDAAIAALKHALQSAHMAEDAQTGIRGCVADSTGGGRGTSKESQALSTPARLPGAIRWRGRSNGLRCLRPFGVVDPHPPFGARQTPGPAARARIAPLFERAFGEVSRRWNLR